MSYYADATQITTGACGFQMTINGVDDPYCVELVENKKYSHLYADGFYIFNANDKLQFKNIGYEIPQFANGRLHITIRKLHAE